MATSRKPAGAPVQPTRRIEITRMQDLVVLVLRTKANKTKTKIRPRNKKSEEDSQNSKLHQLDLLGFQVVKIK